MMSGAVALSSEQLDWYLLCYYDNCCRILYFGDVRTRSCAPGDSDACWCWSFLGRFQFLEMLWTLNSLSSAYGISAHLGVFARKMVLFEMPGELPASKLDGSPPWHFSHVTSIGHAWILTTCIIAAVDYWFILWQTIEHDIPLSSVWSEYRQIASVPLN